MRTIYDFRAEAEYFLCTLQLGYTGPYRQQFRRASNKAVVLDEQPIGFAETILQAKAQSEGKGYYGLS